MRHRAGRRWRIAWYAERVKIDRKRFFSLVTAIAGVTACAKEAAAPVPELAPLEVAVPPQPPPPPDPTMVASAQPPPVPTRPLAAPSSEAVPASSMIDRYDPSGKHTCAELRCPTGSPAAEGMRVLLHDCRALERGLRPEPFQRFIQCMLHQNNTRATCDLLLVGTDPGECLERWSEPPVLAPQTAAVCAPVVQKCGARPPPSPPTFRIPGQPVPPPPPPKPPLTVAACQGVLSVTKDTAQKKMIACMTEYCEDAPGLCYMNL